MYEACSKNIGNYWVTFQSISKRNPCEKEEKEREREKFLNNWIEKHRKCSKYIDNV